MLVRSLRKGGRPEDRLAEQFPGERPRERRAEVEAHSPGERHVRFDDPGRDSGPGDGGRQHEGPERGLNRMENGGNDEYDGGFVFACPGSCSHRPSTSL